MDETKNIPESLSPRLKKNTAAAYTLLALLWVGLGLGVQPLWALCLSYFSTAGISFLNGMQAANATNTNYYYWNYCTVYNSTQSAYVTPASQLNPGATGYTLQQQTVVLKQNWICSYNNRTDIYYSINCSWQSNITAFWAAEAPEPTCSLTANPSTIRTD